MLEDAEGCKTEPLVLQITCTNMCICIYFIYPLSKISDNLVSHEDTLNNPLVYLLLIDASTFE